MYTYKAYGIGISSELPLPDFTPDTEGNDIVVRYVEDDAWSDPFQETNGHVEVREQDSRFWFKRAGSFRVHNGNSIDVMPLSSGDEQILHLYVQGMLMAMALYQRGLCVLHASVMEIHGKAFGFLGPVGAGKSSTAAALHRRGNALVSDDNAAIYQDSSGSLVFPAYPSVKLFPEIAQSLGYGQAELRPLHPSLPKVAGSLKHNFANCALPLKRLYVLSRDCDAGITPLSRQQSLIELIRHSVPTRWGCNGGADHLQRCARLANALPMLSVRTFDTLSSLPELAEQLEAHCMSESEDEVEMAVGQSDSYSPAAKVRLEPQIKASLC